MEQGKQIPESVPKAPAARGSPAAHPGANWVGLLSVKKWEDLGWEQCFPIKNRDFVSFLLQAPGCGQSGLAFLGNPTVLGVSGEVTLRSE